MRAPGPSCAGVSRAAICCASTKSGPADGIDAGGRERSAALTTLPGATTTDASTDAHTAHRTARRARAVDGVIPPFLQAGERPRAAPRWTAPGEATGRQRYRARMSTDATAESVDLLQHL